MLIYAGIDEAGYGPMLGPLCVGSSVFVMESHEDDGRVPDLWKHLDRVVSRQLSKAKGRVTITDSKKLKGARSGRSHPLRHLERGVLTCLGAMEPDSSLLDGLSEDELFRRLGIRIPDHPWYADSGPIPLASDLGLLRIDASRMRRAMMESGIQCVALGCEALDAGDFNRKIGEMHNKAGVNMHLVIRQAESIWNRFPGEKPRIVVDRQGGKTSYRSDLMTAWPQASIRIIHESPELSRYELELPGRGELVMIFTAESEIHHLPVALASMTAKYSRELMMGRMNRFFLNRQPGIRATAGYVEDARRYLSDIEPVLESDHIDRADLIRCC